MDSSNIEMSNERVANTTTTKFIYMGDPQCSRISGKPNDYSQWRKLLELAVRKAYASSSNSDVSCGLLVLGGDLVNRGDKQEEWDAFFDAGRGLLQNLKVAYPSESHEAEEKKSQINEMFSCDGIDSIGRERSFYSFDYGCCHFLVLDSSMMATRHKKAQKHIGNWIRDDLQDSEKQVTFVLMHHPPVTVGSSFNDDVIANTIKESYLKLLLKYRVDFILCGHEHLYCRTGEIGAEELGLKANAKYKLIQLMGVSGTKYFDGPEMGRMEFFKESTSVATVFEVSDDRVKLETFDPDGNTVDSYERAPNPKLKKDCTKCPKYQTCKGNRTDSNLDMDRLRELLLPENMDGISVLMQDERLHLISDGEFESLPEEEVRYSVMRRGKLREEVKRGVKLGTLLEAAGWNGKGEALVVTSDNLTTNALQIDKIMMANEYITCSQVPALVFREDGGYRIAFGQQNPREYNGRLWLRGVREIEIL